MKQQKTLDANQKALKAAEKKAQAQLKQVLLQGVGEGDVLRRFYFCIEGCFKPAGTGRESAWPASTLACTQSACSVVQRHGVASPLRPPHPLPHSPPSRSQVRSAAPVITRKPFWFEKFHWFISSGGGGVCVCSRRRRGRGGGLARLGGRPGRGRLPMALAPARSPLLHGGPPACTGLMLSCSFRALPFL